MRWLRFVGTTLLCGATLFVVGTLFHFLTQLAAPSLEVEYRNDALFRPWTGWTRYYMLAHPWLFAVIFTGIFVGAKILVGRSNLGGVRDGLLYGIALFGVGSLPVFALNFASFQVSPSVVTLWAMQSFCQYALAGMILGWCYPRVGSATGSWGKRSQ